MRAIKHTSCVGLLLAHIPNQTIRIIVKLVESKELYFFTLLISSNPVNVAVPKTTAFSHIRKKQITNNRTMWHESSVLQYGQHASTTYYKKRG